MRTREVIAPWNDMQEGGIRRVLVHRESPDLPETKGAIGYGVIRRDGNVVGDVLLVRVYDAADQHPHAWVAPFQNGAWHTMRDGDIEEFREFEMTPTVLPGDIRDAVRNALDSQPLPSRASLVDDVVERIIALYSIH